MKNELDKQTGKLDFQMGDSSTKLEKYKANNSKLTSQNHVQIEGEIKLDDIEVETTKEIKTKRILKTTESVTQEKTVDINGVDSSNIDDLDNYNKVPNDVQANNQNKLASDDTATEDIPANDLHDYNKHPQNSQTNNDDKLKNDASTPSIKNEDIAKANESQSKPPEESQSANYKSSDVSKNAKTTEEEPESNLPRQRFNKPYNDQQNQEINANTNVQNKINDQRQKNEQLSKQTTDEKPKENQDKKKESKPKNTSNNSKKKDDGKKDPSKKLKEFKIKLIFIGIAGFSLIILLLFLGIFMDEDGEYDGTYYGLAGYTYVEPRCKEITISNGSYAGTYDLEEYIAGVVAAEFGVFASSEKWYEAAKAGAVAARSFVQTNVSSNCTIESSSNKQNFGQPTEETKAVTEQTRGIVLTRNGNIISGQYDAFCTDYMINTEHQSDDYYIVCQKEQKVPKSWADSIAGISESWKSGNKNGAHGNGMSAWGAAYLSEQGSTWEDILNYYYDDVTLASVYGAFAASTNYTYEISNGSGSTIAANIASKPLREILSSTQYSELNNLIYDSVMSYGIGTRDAVVIAAVTPIKYLAENFGVLIPYTLAGGHGWATMPGRSNYSSVTDKSTTSYYGVDPAWGTPISYDYNYHGSMCHYDNYGPDCSSFVPWVFHNAGLNMSVGLAGDFVNYGTKHTDCDSFVAQPGDLFESSGHITVIVGVDETNKLYYVAHASGGNYGTKISPMSFCQSGYYAIDMTNYYANSSNISTTYENNFKGGVQSY